MFCVYVLTIVLEVVLPPNIVSPRIRWHYLVSLYVSWLGDCTLLLRELGEHARVCLPNVTPTVIREWLHIANSQFRLCMPHT